MPRSEPAPGLSHWGGIPIFESTYLRYDPPVHKGYAILPGAMMGMPEPAVVIIHPDALAAFREKLGTWNGSEKSI